MKGVADTSESDGMEWMEEHFRVRPQLPEDVVSLARNLKLDCAEALSKEDPRGKMPMACFPLLFWDFLSLSLPQQCREEGAGKEKEGTEASTQAEHILKRFALEKGWVSFVYRNLSENVYFLRDTLVPSGDTRVTIKTPYHLRGWATFEKCLVAGKDRERIYQQEKLHEFSSLMIFPEAYLTDDSVPAFATELQQAPCLRELDLPVNFDDMGAGLTAEGFSGLALLCQLQKIRVCREIWRNKNSPEEDPHTESISRSNSEVEREKEAWPEFARLKESIPGLRIHWW
uniref:Uncharacterized protein n=1 Tax=Chromera velia CCMP2878 TaxID=1169474 RepID=A0A0G4HTE4_9ALVE|eukprot:Cvel_8460.t1-p1 / transcript=Cvel_8460.t1 / gene=Cvel_8460 / organism=Chromera_velia_CCMP2878 / gene_product=hypothetical protein / transcript_product=hypothetical protein / location=Cvel_scaffold467:56415-57705(-) / protein_length=285 / sequence_SO=supercontig / SO=protein_coding / is_pseudo=false